MACDMCGSEKKLFECRVEGVVLNVCIDCSKHGTIIKKTIEKPPIKTIVEKSLEKEETIQIINHDYNSIIKNKRELKGLKQKELAKKIAEKESVIHNIESRHMEPSIALAKKLENFLGIKLIKEYKEKKISLEKEDSGSLTIGDIMKTKD